MNAPITRATSPSVDVLVIGDFMHNLTTTATDGADGLRGTLAGLVPPHALAPESEYPVGCATIVEAVDLLRAHLAADQAGTALAVLEVLAQQRVLRLAAAGTATNALPVSPSVWQGLAERGVDHRLVSTTAALGHTRLVIEDGDTPSVLHYTPAQHPIIEHLRDISDAVAEAAARARVVLLVLTPDRPAVCAFADLIAKVRLLEPRTRVAIDPSAFAGEIGELTALLALADLVFVHEQDIDLLRSTNPSAVDDLVTGRPGTTVVAYGSQTVAVFHPRRHTSGLPLRRPLQEVVAATYPWTPTLAPANLGPSPAEQTLTAGIIAHATRPHFDPQLAVRWSIDLATNHALRAAAGRP